MAPGDHSSSTKPTLVLTEFLASLETLSDKDKELKMKKEFWEPSVVKIEDFGFPNWDVRHWGQTIPSEGGAIGSDEDEYSDAEDDIELAKKAGGGSCSGLAKALYDFEAENPSELSFRKGDELYIHYRQCEGWLVGFYKEDKLGLIPENYVEFVKTAADKS